MGKRRKNKGKRSTPALTPEVAAPPPSVSVATPTTTKEEEENYHYPNKLVYASLSTIINEDSTLSWAEIDPHYSGPLNDDDHHQDGIAFNKINIPADLDLRQLAFYKCAVCDSKVYFCGGMRMDMDMDGPDVFSEKVFVYDLTSKKWEEGPPMNVARAFPRVAAVGNVIYVFGGRTEKDVVITSSKEKWGECYNVDSKTWEFLPTPPQAILHKSSIKFVTVYEHRNQILLWTRLAGVYSYNYVTKTWISFNPAINKYNTFIYHHVAIVEDILFWHYFGTIHAYDLSSNRYLSSHCVDENNKTAFEPDYYGCFPDPAFLVCVGKQTLFLISGDLNCRDDKIRCYRFQIVKSSSQDDSGKGGAGECGFQLMCNGRAVFDIPGYLLGSHAW